MHGKNITITDKIVDDEPDLHCSIPQRMLKHLNLC